VRCVSTTAEGEILGRSLLRGTGVSINRNERPLRDSFVVDFVVISDAGAGRCSSDCRRPFVCAVGAERIFRVTIGIGLAK
jgi:hypothetical protein